MAVGHFIHLFEARSNVSEDRVLSERKYPNDPKDTLQIPLYILYE